MVERQARRPRVPTSDRYEIHAPIGSGGMGTVYRALDRATGLPVAVKVLHAKVGENPIAHARLAVEFKAASGLDHPNIVRALAAECDGQIAFLVYELVEAGSLAARIDAHGKVPENTAVRTVTQVAQALHYAHERRVVHRDVKPDNILILPDGRAKLTDFGLAKDHTDPAQDLTRHASGLGTPHYMAPEQFADAKAADARCDVYSLAATLYEAVTGILPFDAKFPLAILTNKELLKIALPRAIVPGLSERVESAIMTALDPDPDRRPATCLEFFKLLTGRNRSREDVLATPPPKRTVPVSGSNRRASARFAVLVGSCAEVDSDVHAGGAVERWPVVIQDVSAGGLGIVLARRFEPGTEMTIELGRTDQPLRFATRVVRVIAETAGHWVHGCEFLEQLTNDQLRWLIKNV